MEDLPVEVTANILSRLPVKKIIHCKCVCKKWLDLVSETYFADLQLSRTPLAIIIHHKPKNEIIGHRKAGILKWLEVEDKRDHHRLHHDPLMGLDLNLAHVFQERHLRLVASVNGLICMWQFDDTFDRYFLCNPITREYMILPLPTKKHSGYALFSLGFGVGSLTREYKVVRISKEFSLPNPTLEYKYKEAEVYTLGTGRWRSLGHVPYLIDGYHDGTFLNGNAHWSIGDKDSPENLCAFDFNNETFKLFPSPPIETIEFSQIRFKRLAILKGCLCQCGSFGSEFTIWVMKEYGIKRSWHKNVIINHGISPDLDMLMWRPMHLIERLRDGTIFMVYSNEKLLAYSHEKRTIADTCYLDSCITGLAYRPSFLKLRNFESETVHVF